MVQSTPAAYLSGVTPAPVGDQQDACSCCSSSKGMARFWPMSLSEVLDASRRFAEHSRYLLHSEEYATMHLPVAIFNERHFFKVKYCARDDL